MSNLNCRSCALGYEATNAGDTDNITCAQPTFRPYRGWEAYLKTTLANESIPLLKLVDTRRNVTVERANYAARTPILLTDHTYSIAVPERLKQHEVMFVGYVQPYLQIRYELDFTRGAEVDIGCGTAVIGNGTRDKPTPKTRTDHPLSMSKVGHYWPGDVSDVCLPSFFLPRC